MSEHVSHEYEKNVTPSKEIVAEAYGDILKHNEEHTGFGALFGGLVRTALKEEGVDVQVSDDIVAEGDMNAALQDIFHSETFTRIGVRMASQFGSFLAYSEGTAATSKAMVPIVQNQSLYTEFLETLEPSDVDDTHINKLLGDVVTNLGRIINLTCSEESINSASPAERVILAEAGEDALRRFIALDDEYSRLGVDNAGLTERSEVFSDELEAALDQELGCNDLSLELRQEYDDLREVKKQAGAYASLSRKVNYWGRNILTEGITADAKGYLIAPAKQGFGPAHWHKDGGQRHWAAAYGFLTQIQEAEHTQEFGAEVKSSLLKSLDTAIAEIETAEEAPYYSSNKADLENVRAAINGDDFDAQKFMAYTQPSGYSQ